MGNKNTMQNHNIIPCCPAPRRAKILWPRLHCQTFAYLSVWWDEYYELPVLYGTGIDYYNINYELKNEAIHINISLSYYTVALH